MTRTGEPFTRRTRLLSAGLLLGWLLLAIGWFVAGNNPFWLALSVLSVIAASVSLWRDWTLRRSADLPPPPE
jgi:hypothetical protein